MRMEAKLASSPARAAAQSGKSAPLERIGGCDAGFVQSRKGKEGGYRLARPAPIVAAAAQTRNPVRQALVSSTGTFWDTVVVCAMTGLVLVNSGDWTRGLTGAALTKTAFADVPVIGPLVLTVGLLTFVFSTILGWSYYGEKAIEYLLGVRAVQPYRALWVVAVMVGSVASLPAVWAFADIANALMALPNLVSLLALTNVVVAETRAELG